MKSSNGRQLSHYRTTESRFTAKETLAMNSHKNTRSLKIHGNMHHWRYIYYQLLNRDK